MDDIVWQAGQGFRVIAWDICQQACQVDDRAHLAKRGSRSLLVGKSVSELSAAFGLSIEMGATLEDIAGTIHAHPTLGEAVQEAAMRALGHALHI